MIAKSLSPLTDPIISIPSDWCMLISGGNSMDKPPITKKQIRARLEGMASHGHAQRKNYEVAFGTEPDNFVMAVKSDLTTITEIMDDIEVDENTEIKPEENYVIFRPRRSKD